MPYTTAGFNAALTELGTLITFVSLHTADPGESGANEVTGGSYARKTITWNPASGGNLDNLANPVFDVPAGVTVTYVGYWSALTGGTMYAYDDVNPQAFAAAGQYTLTDADLTFVNG